jgi:hypothetical protein
MAVSFRLALLGTAGTWAGSARNGVQARVPTGEHAATWRRAATTPLVVAAVALGLTACVPARNLATDRDLVCRETPDDLCIRIADLALSRMNVDAEERNVGRIPTIQVYPTPCADVGPAPAAVRCWTVEATAESGAGIGVGIFQQADGSLH